MCQQGGYFIAQVSIVFTCGGDVQGSISRFAFQGRMVKRLNPPPTFRIHRALYELFFNNTPALPELGRVVLTPSLPAF